MALTLQTEQIDDDTREYLRLVHKYEGADLPGIHVEDPSWLPTIGLIIGIFTITITLVLTLGSLEDPLRITFLQTGGLLFGGWCTLAALRALLHTSSENYLGHFHWFDPEHWYHVKGDHVTITPLAPLVSVETAPGGKSDKLYFTTANGKFTATVANSDGIRRILVYYDVLLSFQHEAAKTGRRRERTEQDFPGRTTLIELPLLVRGLSARFMAEYSNLPPQPEELPSRFDHLPEPQRARSARGPWLSYLLILAGTGATFFGLYQFNRTQRDENFFAAVKDQSAPQLRAYLLDKYNVAHRAEVQARLDDRYKQAKERLRVTLRNQALITALDYLLESLRPTSDPVVTLRVSEQGKTTNQESLSTAFTQALGQVIDDSLIGYAHAVEGVPPLLEVTYRWEDLKAIEWTWTFRTSVNDPGKTVVLRAPLLPTEAQLLTPGETVQHPVTGAPLAAGPQHKPAIIDAAFQRAWETVRLK